MKYLLILLLVSVKGYGQELISLPMQDGKVYYERVYEDSATKDQLFERAKDVFIRLFPNSKRVIQDEDKENGVITGKGNFDFNINGGAFNSSFVQTVECTFRITVKDYKYRVEIFDLYSITADLQRYPIEAGYYTVKEKKKKVWYRYYDEMNKTILDLFDRIEHEMNKKQTEW